MYKMVVKMIVSMMILSSVFVKAMDLLPSAAPCKELIEEMENNRKMAEAKKDALAREKYVRCIEIFHEQSNEVRKSFEDSNSINSVASLPK